MMLGDNWEHWQGVDMDMHQSHWAMKRWSLVVTLPTGKFTFIIVWDDNNFLSDLETEIWNFTNENQKIINPTLPNSHYKYGIALYIVPFDFCST